jgi:hypothetical protein
MVAGGYGISSTDPCRRCGAGVRAGDGEGVMWDRESIGIVALLVVTIAVVVAVCYYGIDQYIVCAKGGYAGSDCISWECFCIEIAEDGIKRFVPLPQVREENARVR